MVKDYNKMRAALACYEAEQLTTEDVYELLLYGLPGYEDNTNEEVLNMFVGLWGQKQIPYIKKQLSEQYKINVNKLKKGVK